MNSLKLTSKENLLRGNVPVQIAKNILLFISNTLSSVFKGIIKGYKIIISPLLPPSCKFYPTCSEYSYDAIERFGPVRGLFLSIKRIVRCSGLSNGGYDPLPESLKGEPLKGEAERGIKVDLVTFKR